MKSLLDWCLLFLYPHELGVLYRDARPCSLSLTLAIRDPTTRCDWMKRTFF